MSLQARERQAALWVMLELVAIDDRQSLEGRGLLRVDLDRAPLAGRLPPPSRASAWTESESWSLLAELVRSRAPAGRAHHARGRRSDGTRRSIRGAAPSTCAATAAEAKRKVISWLPTRGSQPTPGLPDAACSPHWAARPTRRRSSDGCWRFIEASETAGCATTHDARDSAWCGRSTTPGCASTPVESRRPGVPVRPVPAAGPGLRARRVPDAAV